VSHQTFFTLADLNAAIWARLDGINDRLMKRLGVTSRPVNGNTRYRPACSL
jgi:hypothetical protein